MLLELARPASVLASLFSLLTVFHAAFLGSETDIRQRIFEASATLMVALAASLASGLIFTLEVKPRPGPRLVCATGRRIPSTDFRLDHWKSDRWIEIDRLLGSFPMRIFYWAVGWMAALFLAAWFVETYCIPLKNLR